MNTNSTAMTMMSAIIRPSTSVADLGSHDTQRSRRTLNPDPSVQSPHSMPGKRGETREEGGREGRRRREGEERKGEESKGGGGHREERRMVLKSDLRPHLSYCTDTGRLEIGH